MLGPSLFRPDSIHIHLSSAYVHFPTSFEEGGGAKCRGSIIEYCMRLGELHRTNVDDGSHLIFQHPRDIDILWGNWHFTRTSKREQSLLTKRDQFWLLRPNTKILSILVYLEVLHDEGRENAREKKIASFRLFTCAAFLSIRLYPFFGPCLSVYLCTIGTLYFTVTHLTSLLRKICFATE